MKEGGEFKSVIVLDKAFANLPQPKVKHKSNGNKEKVHLD